MAHMHLIFVLLMFKKYNESSLNPAWRPPLWFPHSHQFCSDNQTFWKLNSPLLLSVLVLHFFLLFFSCVCLSLHIYAFISGCWAMGCGPAPVSRSVFDHHHGVWHFTSFFCNCNFNGPFNTVEIYNMPGGLSHIKLCSCVLKGCHGTLTVRHQLNGLRL